MTEMNKNEFLHGKFSIVRTLIVAAIAAPIFLAGFIYATYKSEMKYLEQWHQPGPDIQSLSPDCLEKAIERSIRRDRGEPLEWLPDDLALERNLRASGVKLKGRKY